MELTEDTRRKRQVCPVVKLYPNGKEAASGQGAGSRGDRPGGDRRSAATFARFGIVSCEVREAVLCPYILPNYIKLKLLGHVRPL